MSVPGVVMGEVVNIEAALAGQHPEVGIGLMVPKLAGAEKLDKGSVEVNGISTIGHRFKYSMSFEWVDRDILVLENVFPFDCAKLATLSDSLNLWKSAQVIDPSGDSYHNKAHRDTDEFTLGGDIHPSLADFEAGAVLAINAAAQVYCTRNPFAIIGQAARFSMLRYVPGQFFGLHVDTVNREGSPLSGRLLSFVAFLNGGMGGGLLEFPRQALSVLPTENRAVVFPSGFTHPHQSHPVTLGVKRSVVSWLHA